MSDPFERLRSSGGVDAPPVATIRARARSIQRRRYVAIVSSSVVVLILAGVGLFVRTNPSPRRRESAASLSNGAATSVAPVPQSAGAEKSAGGASTGGALSSGGTTTTQNSGSSSSDALLSPGGSAGGRYAPSTALDLSVTAASHAPGEDFTLKACNNGTSNVTRSFPTSQRFDFQVSRGGSVVWRWSDGQAFSNIVGSETWKPHECKTWTATWNGMMSNGGVASPGSYSVVGVLKSSTNEPTKRATFCLDVC